MTAGRGSGGADPDRCVGCGGHFAHPEINDSHHYMLSSAGCWTAYGDMLAREYQDPALFAACHRLTVDAYAVQHRGDPSDRRAGRSVWLHYSALHAVFAEGATHVAARGVIQSLARVELPPLPATLPTFTMTLADIVDQKSGDHAADVMRWAAAAFEDWRPLLGKPPHR